MTTNPVKVHLNQVYKPKQSQVSATFKYGDLTVDWAKLKEVYSPVTLALTPAWIKSTLATTQHNYDCYDCDSSSIEPTPLSLYRKGIVPTCCKGCALWPKSPICKSCQAIKAETMRQELGLDC